jgi:small basic protein
VLTTARLKPIAWLTLAGVAIGVAAGYFWGPKVPLPVARYAAAWLLCCLEALLALLAKHEQEQVATVILRLLAYVALTGILLAISDRLGMELYLAAFAALGFRIFSHIDALIGGVGHVR